MGNDRRQGESINQWRNRIINQNRYGTYAGELEPSIIRADSSSISNGAQYVGSKANNYKVNQRSLLGERKYNPDSSIAQKIINGLTDKLHITSPPTFTDGYGRTLNSETPLWEGAQGQQLKRMGDTALKGMTIVGTGLLPFSLYTAPLATISGLGTGFIASKGTNSAMDLIEKVSDKKFTPSQRTFATFLASLPAGTEGYKWGWNAEKRAIESAMTASGGSSIPIESIKQTYRHLSKQNKKDLIKYIFTGKGKKPGEILGPANSYFGSGEYGWGGETGRGNMVRAYLYDEPIPELHEVIGEGKYGVHEDYIIKKYPHKYGKIRVYEGTDMFYNPTTDNVIPMKSEGINGDMTFRTPVGRFNVDAGGHRMEYGLGENGWYNREQDIWKFNPKDYKARWASGQLKNRLTNWGLNFVDSHGTPVVVRTTWGSKPIPISSIDNYNTHFATGEGNSFFDPSSGIKAPTFNKWAKETTFNDYLDPQYDNVPSEWLDEIFKTAPDEAKLKFKKLTKDYYDGKLTGQENKSIYDLINQGSDIDIDTSNKTNDINFDGTAVINKVADWLKENPIIK